MTNCAAFGSTILSVDRYDFAIKNKICTFCLREAHIGQKCPVPYRVCKYCPSGDHCTMLHASEMELKELGYEKKKTTVAKTVNDAMKKSQTTESVVKNQITGNLHAQSGPTNRSTLSSSVITVQNPHTLKQLQINVLGDDCANHIVACSSVAKELGIKGTEISYTITGHGGFKKTYTDIRIIILILLQTVKE